MTATTTGLAEQQQPQSYMHHHHIVEHKDNEVMRPFTGIP